MRVHVVFGGSERRRGRGGGGGEDVMMREGRGGREKTSEGEFRIHKNLLSLSPIISLKEAKTY